MSEMDANDEFDSDNEGEDKPLQFDTIFAPDNCKYLLGDDEKHVIFCTAEADYCDDLPTAISNHVMTEGRHYCL